MPQHEQDMRRAFEVRGGKRLADMFFDIREKKRQRPDWQPNWLGEQVFDRLQGHWASSAFQKKAEQAKAARASEKGGSLNTCGSITFDTYGMHMVCSFSFFFEFC